ncbi:hypothetical protein GCM10027594_02780 [Hymenobacter agri]
MGGTLYTFNGGGTSGNWTDANIWTTDPTGSTSVNPRVPTTGDAVVVTNSFVVYVSSAVSTTGLDLTIQRGGVLDLQSAAATFGTLNSLSGQGTLRIGAPYFPAVTTNNFDDANTGTVEFYNWPVGPTNLPQPASNQFCNLRLLNTTGTAYTVQLNNDLTLTGSLSTTRTNAALTLNIGGTASTNRTLNVQGDVTIGTGTTLGVTAVAGNHNISVTGSLVNNGTINLRNGADTQAALLTFTGASNANFACNGATDLDMLRVDKGIDSQVTLNVTSTVSVSGGAQGNLRLNHSGAVDMLQLVNGVTKLGNNVYLAKISNDLNNGFSLGSSATSPTLWIAGATVVSDNMPLIAVYGTYRISAGQFTDNYDGGMVVREDGQVLIEGGTTKVNKFRPSRTSANHRGSFIITGGDFYCTGTTGTSVDDKFARFSVPYVTQGFRMTGGTIHVQNVPGPTKADGMFHIGVNPNNAIVTGGTVEIMLPASADPARILSTAPLWNLIVKKAGAGTSKAINQTMPFDANFAANATTAAQPLTVQNDFTLDPTVATTFDANSLDLTIQGTFTIGSGCTYLTGTNTTIFSGTKDQQLVNNGDIGATAGSSIFRNWTVNKAAGTLQLAGSTATYTVPSGATLSLLQGVLNDGGKIIYVTGNMVNSASHTSGGGSGNITLNGAAGQTVSGDGTGVFGNLKISNTAAAGAVGVTFSANMSVASTLTMVNENILAIGTNRLSLTNVISSGAGAALVTGPGLNFGKTYFIQTAGNQSDLGLQKTYGKGDTFVFPVGTGVGTGAIYAPATITLQLATGAPLDKFGQVSVSPVKSRNPFVAGTNNLNYYWKVRSTGFGPIPAGSVYESFQATNSLATPTTLSGYVPGRYIPIAWNTYSAGAITVGGTVSTIAFDNLDNFPGEFTAGTTASFGPVTAYYTRATGNWETAGTWSTAGFNGAAASVKPGAGNPVFIESGRTVTVTAANAVSGSLEIASGGILDLQGFTGHNFGALPDSKPGGSGTLRITAPVVKSGPNYFATPVFPSGDFGSFLQAGGGTVEYYGTTSSNAYTFSIPTSSASSLNLNSYQNLTLNPVSNGEMLLPNLDLQIYGQLVHGTSGSFTGTSTISGGTAGNLQVGALLNVINGKLRTANGTARTLAFNGDVQVGTGSSFDLSGGGAAVTNNVTVAGSITNNGTLDFNMTSTANLTFTSSTTTNLTGTNGSAFTDLKTLTLNKGTGRTATLNVDVAGTLTTPTSGWLTLTNGTLRFAKASGTLTVHNAESPYLITDNAGLTVDAPTATVTVATGTTAASDLRLAGEMRVLQGNMNVGLATSTGGSDLEYASAGAPTLKVTTGKLYVNGQIRRTVNNLDGSLRFDQSGGTIDVDGLGATAAQNNERGLFEVQGPGSIFRMSGGTLSLHRSNGRPTIAGDLYLAPDSTVVTGGTVVLGNAAAGVGNVTVSVDSTVPLYDLRVETGANNTNTNTGLHTGVLPLTLKGSLTIGNDNSFFNANGLPLNIYQNLLNSNSSTSTALNAGGFQPITADQTTTFLGGVATQQLTGTGSNQTVFGALVLNTPQTNGQLQLNGAARTVGTLTLTKGTLNDNGYILTALGDVLNSATHTSSGAGSITLAGTTNQKVGGNGLGRFGNLVLNNGAGATTTTNQEVTGALTLNNGIFNIGSNLLWFSNPAGNAVAGAFSTTRYIQTNGIVADQGVRKTYASGPSNFGFPVGAPGKYTPVQINLTSNSAAGTITVQPVDRVHPSTTDPANKELKYYWKISSTGLGSPTTDKQFSYIAGDVTGTEANYKLGRFLAGAWNPLNGIASSTVDANAHTLLTLSTNQIDGDYTGGETSEFGKVPVFYSRTATAGLPAGAAWNTAAAWTFNANGSDSSPLPTVAPTLANPVAILPGHYVYSTGPGLGAATLQLDGTLNLNTYAANNFNTVSGTGILQIGSALFPAGNYANFVAPSTGTVEFTGAVQLPARNTYNNLTLSGGTAKLLSNLDLTINGALNVAASTQVDNPSNQNLTLTSATSGALINGTFNLYDGNLNTASSLTVGTTGTLNLGAGTVSTGTTLATLGAGRINQGAGLVQAGTSFNNAGTYNAGAGNTLVGKDFNNDGTYNAATGNLTVNGNTNITAAGTFTASNGAVDTGGNFTNVGTYAATTNNIMHVTGDFLNQSGGSFDAANSNVVFRANFTNQGSFSPGTSLVQFITDINRFINGNTYFYDLQKLGTSNLTFGPATNIHVGRLMTIQNSYIYTGNNTGNVLYLDNSSTQPIVGNTLTSYVVGRLAMAMPDAAGNSRVFPVGAGQRYRPVTIKNVGGSSNATVLVEIINSAPSGSVDATLDNLSANRYYRIQTLSGTMTNPTIQLSFNTDVIDEQVNVPGNLRVAKTTGPIGPSTTWSTAGGAGVYSPDAPRGYTISASNQTAINGNTFFALASTNRVDNPLTGSAPLPVSLISFSATRQGSAVQVAWATASEKNSAYFMVERSADGRSFNELRRVEALGNSTSRHEYGMLDNAPLGGTSYYRLRQVDKDGTVAYSNVAAVRFEGKTGVPSLVAYPNPATDKGFQLAAANLAPATGTVRVVDNVGRVVFIQTIAAGTAEVTVQPAQPLASGMYFATWTTADGVKLTTKVSVQ